MDIRAVSPTRYSVDENGTVYLTRLMRPLSGQIVDGVRCVGSNKLSVARLVLLAFRPISSAKHYMPEHINGDRMDCRLVNLRWKYRYGENHGRAVLTEKQVIAARSRFFAGESQTDIAAEYGVDKTTVWAAINQVWRHVK